MLLWRYQQLKCLVRMTQKIETTAFKVKLKVQLVETSDNRQCASDSVRTGQMSHCSSSKKTHQITKNRPKQVNSRQSKITQAREAKVLKKRGKKYRKDIFRWKESGPERTQKELKKTRP